MKIITGGQPLDELSRDAGIERIVPAKACIVSTEDEVVEALDLAVAEGLSVTPRGGGTSIPSQAVGRGLILLQDSRDAVVLPGGLVACGAGVVKADLNSKLAAVGAWMPVDPSSYASCTVGGMVANNSSGVRTPKYGSVIDHVRGLRAVMPGRGPEALAPTLISEMTREDPWTKVAELIQNESEAIADEAPKVTKNSSGYRLERAVRGETFDPSMVMVGSEGTLGVLTQVTFSTSARPNWRILLIAETSLADLNEMAAEFRKLAPTALELVDKSVFRRTGRAEEVAKYSKTEEGYMLFCELDGTQGTAIEKAEEVAGSGIRAFDPIVLTGGEEIAQAWEVRNETLRLAQDIKKDGRVLVPGVEDLVVPPGRLGDLVRLLTSTFERLGLEFISYGHAGDANLHARPMLDLSLPNERRILDEMMEECFSEVWKMGGSMTGEHGDGMLRARFVPMQYPRTYHIMKEIRRTLDPKGLLSPGVKIA